MSAPVSIAITPSTLPSGTVSSLYSQAVTFTGGGGVVQPYSFTLISGSLPPGLTFSPSYFPLTETSEPGTTVLSGIPTTPGTYTFTIRASAATPS